MKRLTKLSIILLALLSIFPNIAFADYGSHSYTAHQIAPDTGNTTAEFINGTDQKYVDHDFLWESWQSWDAYWSSSAFEGKSPVGMEVDINFYGYDCVSTAANPCAGRYVFATEPRSEYQSSRGTYWTSDVPYAYIDVTYLDNEEEPGVGMGSGYWVLANESEYYEMFTHVTADDTYLDTTYDDYKVRVARTHNHNDGWYGDSCDGSYDNPWCNFQDDPSVEVIPNWHGNTPEVDHVWHDPKFNYAYIDGNHDNNTP